MCAIDVKRAMIGSGRGKWPVQSSSANSFNVEGASALSSVVSDLNDDKPVMRLSDV